MFGGSFQLPTSAELCFIVWTLLSDLITACSAVVLKKLGGAAEYLTDGSEKCICRLSFEFLSPHVIKEHSNGS